MMRSSILGAVLISLSATTVVCQATLVFSQDFSAGGPVSRYVSPTPDEGQWNSIGSGTGVTVSISGGALSYTRGSSGTGSFSRTTDFSPPADVLIYRFDLTVSGNTVAKTTAATWQVGSGFGTANAAESPGLVHSRFAINLLAQPGNYQFRDLGTLANSSTFSGRQAVTWVVNNSGRTASYLAPNNTWQTLANDRWDLWAGPIRVFDEARATTATQPLTDLKFVFEGGNGTIAMDNFRLEAVPESPLALPLAVCVACGAAVIYRRRSGLNRATTGCASGKNDCLSQPQQ